MGQEKANWMFRPSRSEESHDTDAMQLEARTALDMDRRLGLFIARMRSVSVLSRFTRYYRQTSGRESPRRVIRDPSFRSLRCSATWRLALKGFVARDCCMRQVRFHGNSSYRICSSGLSRAHLALRDEERNNDRACARPLQLVSSLSVIPE